MNFKLCGSDDSRIVTEGHITVIVDPIDKKTVRIKVYDRITGKKLMEEVVGAKNLHSPEKRPAS